MATNANKVDPARWGPCILERAGCTCTGCMTDKQYAAFTAPGFARTLNADYDAVRASWAASGHDSKPECERCGVDLAAKVVRRTGSGWFCAPCYTKERNEPPVAVEPREDFHADLGGPSS
jgi:hypothetical protein